MKKWAAFSAGVFVGYEVIIFTVGVSWWGVPIGLVIGANFGWSAMRAIGQHQRRKRQRELQRFFDMMTVSEAELQRWRDAASFFSDSYRWKPDDDDPGPDAA